MSRYLLALLTVLLWAGSAHAIPSQFPIPLRFVTADGTWDCKDAGVLIGTVIVVENAYSFLTPDSKVAGYGRLFRVGREDYDLPHFVIVDGPLKAILGYSGTTMRGPKEDYENYGAGLFFVLLKDGGEYVDCVRRLLPGLLQ